MFDLKFFGYDRNQVEDEISQMTEKIEGQQRDLDYLREENKKLKNKMKQKRKQVCEDMTERQR